MSRDLILGTTRRHWARGLGPTSCLGYAPVVDGLPQPDPLTGEQKEDIRTYLRHLPKMDSTFDVDNQKFVRQLTAMYGPLRDKVRQGDREALAVWQKLVSWTNSLQQEALNNQMVALVMLRNISRAELFSPRFRIAL